MTNEKIREFCEKMLKTNGVCEGKNPWSCADCPAMEMCGDLGSTGTRAWCVEWLENHPEDEGWKELRTQILNLQKRVEALEAGDVKEGEAILNPTVFVPTFGLKCKYKKIRDDKMWSDGTIVGYSEGSMQPYKVKSDSTRSGQGDWVGFVMVDRKDYDTHVEHIGAWVTRHFREE